MPKLSNVGRCLAMVLSIVQDLKMSKITVPKEANNPIDQTPLRADHREVLTPGVHSENCRSCTLRTDGSTANVNAIFLDACQ